MKMRHCHTHDLRLWLWQSCKGTSEHEPAALSRRNALAQALEEVPPSEAVH
jgi:hypothetical protein